MTSVFPIAGLDALARQRGAWLEVWEQAAGERVFLRAEWVLPWFRHLGQPASARGLVVSRGGEPLGLALLSLEALLPGPSPFTALRLPGLGASDYLDLLLPAEPSRRAEALACLLDWLLEAPGWDVLDLPNLPAESPTLAALQAEVLRRGLAAFRVRTYARPFIQLAHSQAHPLDDGASPAGGWDAYLASRPGKFRYNLRSRQKRLAQLGRLTFSDSAGADELSSRLERMVELHAGRWAGRRTGTVFSAARRGRAFYGEACAAMAPAGLLSVASLDLDGRMIAGSLVLRDRDTLYYYLPAFDPALAKYAPSTILLAHLVEQAFAEGLARFDFMLGDEPYKRAWTSTLRHSVRLVVAAPGPAGQAGLASLAAYVRLREAARRSRLAQQLRQRGPRGLLAALRGKG